MAYNKNLTEIKTPAGNKTSFTAAAGYNGGILEKVQLHISGGVDAANQVTAATLRGDDCSWTRVSQGLYRFTLGGATATTGKYSIKKMLTCIPHLQSAATSNLMAKLDAVSESAGTVDVKVINMSTGAVADPPAVGANERLHLVATFDNGAS